METNIKIKISKSIPPIYYECKKRFGVSWDKGIIITYGDTVYSKFPLPDDLKIHELTHVKQQEAYGPEKWWEDYFKDKKFRLFVEKEAYLNQSRWIKENMTGKRKDMRLEKICADLSSSIYGNIISREEANKLLM